MGAPWRNDKLGPLDNVMGNSRSQCGPLDDTMINWDLLITWWEIRGHHFDDMMRKWGPLMVRWKIWAPLMMQWGKVETLNKAMGKWGGAKWPATDGETGNWALDGAVEHLEVLWWCNGQIRDPSNGKIGAPWWPDGETRGPRPQIIFKWFNTAPLYCTLSNLWAQILIEKF